jgi:hypothetical protein
LSISRNRTLAKVSAHPVNQNGEEEEGGRGGRRNRRRRRRRRRRRKGKCDKRAI